MGYFYLVIKGPSRTEACIEIGPPPEDDGKKDIKIMMNSIFDVKKKFHLFSSLYSMNIDSYFGPRRVQITIIFLYLWDDSFFNSLFRLVLPFIQKIIQNHSFLLKTLFFQYFPRIDSQLGFSQKLKWLWNIPSPKGLKITAFPQFLRKVSCSAFSLVSRGWNFIHFLSAFSFKWNQNPCFKKKIST